MSSSFGAVTRVMLMDGWRLVRLDSVLLNGFKHSCFIIILCADFYDLVFIESLHETLLERLKKNKMVNNRQEMATSYSTKMTRLFLTCKILSAKPFFVLLWKVLSGRDAMKSFLKSDSRLMACGFVVKHLSHFCLLPFSSSQVSWGIRQRFMVFLEKGGHTLQVTAPILSDWTRDLLHVLQCACYSATLLFSVHWLGLKCW